MKTRTSSRSPFVTPLLVWCIVLSVAVFAVWVWSHFVSIGLLSFGDDTSVKIWKGVAEVRQIYAYNIDAPIPEAEWHDQAIARGWTVPPPPKYPVFEYSSGRVIGQSGERYPPGTIVPAEYRLLRIPLWVIPAVLLLPWLVVRAWQSVRAGSPIPNEVLHDGNVRKQNGEPTRQQLAGQTGESVSAARVA